MSIVTDTNMSQFFIGEVDSRYVFLLPVARKGRLDTLDEYLFLKANFATNISYKYHHSLKHIVILSNLVSWCPISW
jgi:hypothetical protein